MMGMQQLTFETRSRAMAEARKLGLDGVHSHMNGGRRVYMPGENHRKLNDALVAAGRAPTPVPGGDSGGDREDGLFGGVGVTDVGVGVADFEAPMDDDRMGTSDLFEAVLGDRDGDGEMEIY